MDMTIRTIRFDPPSSANFVDGGENPSQQRGNFLFHKSQLDSRNFGVAGPMGLWTRYHSKLFVWFSSKLKNNKIFR